MTSLYLIELTVLAIYTGALFYTTHLMDLTRKEYIFVCIALSTVALLWFFALYLVLKQSF